MPKHSAQAKSADAPWNSRRPALTLLPAMPAGALPPSNDQIANAVSRVFEVTRQELAGSALSPCSWMEDSSFRSMVLRKAPPPCRLANSSEPRQRGETEAVQGFDARIRSGSSQFAGSGLQGVRGVA